MRRLVLAVENDRDIDWPQFEKPSSSLLSPMRSPRPGNLELYRANLGKHSSNNPVALRWACAIIVCRNPEASSKTSPRELIGGP
jgi:hypothetical protein